MKANHASIDPSRPRLVDLLGDGVRMLLDLRGPTLPGDHEDFLAKVSSFTDTFHRNALFAGYAPDVADDATYAICAAIDEAVLASSVSFRDAWEAQPLQLTRFGDQLAGDHFFARLDNIRKRGVSQAEVAEVYHLCMKLGFKGRFALDDDAKLRYLTTTLGSDIAHSRGATGALAHRGARLDAQRFSLRRLASTWTIVAILAFGLFLAGSSFRMSTSQQGKPLAGRDNLVQVPAKVARLKITLP
jgi:type VI secretion system protein ImpK